MIGNAWELVADWDETIQECSNWDPEFGSDLSCIGRGSEAQSTGMPSVVMRGGQANLGTNAGAFATMAAVGPGDIHADYIGFRGAR